MTHPKDAVIWFEIPVTDLNKARKFYEDVLQTSLLEQEMGPNTTMIFAIEDMRAGVSGHLYEGKPASDNGPTVHLSAPAPLEQTLERLKAGGGKVVSDEVQIPIGRFFYCQDPDGNSIGLFSPEGK